MSLIETFAKSFHKARLAQGLSQSQLAEKAGITVSYVSMLERGLRSPPLETIDSLALALRVKPLQLLGSR